MSQMLFKTNRSYRLVLSASTLSNLGDGVSTVAMPWLATILTRDPLLISGVAMAGRLPWFLFALPAGVWTDRTDRKLLIIRADLIRLASSLAIAAMMLSLPSHPPSNASPLAPIIALSIFAFLLGIAEVIRDNAAQTLLPSIVNPDDLDTANGQFLSAEQLMNRFIGPPLAGVLISAGIAAPFGFGATAFALSAAMISLISLPLQTAHYRKRFWPALVDGFRWMKESRTILQLAIMLAVINAVSVGGMTIFILYAQEVLDLSARGYGFLLTCGAAGGVIGGLVAPAITRRIGIHKSLIVSLSTLVALNIVLGIFRSAELAALALFLEAAGGMLWNVVTVSYRQRLIPTELLGRVNSVYRFFSWGAMPFGAIAAGTSVTLLEPHIGRLPSLQAPYLIGAAVFLSLLFYGAFRLKFVPQ